jgi:hypothetical protein
MCDFLDNELEELRRVGSRPFNSYLDPRLVVFDESVIEEPILGSLASDVAVGRALDDEDPLVGSCADQRAFGNAEEIT